MHRDEFEFEITEQELGDGRRVVAVSGEFDMVTAPELDQRLAQLSAEQVPVRLDLRGLTFMDSSGLGVLIAAAKRAANGAARLEIVRPTGEPWRVVELTAVQDVLPFADGDED